MKASTKTMNCTNPTSGLHLLSVREAAGATCHDTLCCKKNSLTHFHTM